MTRKSSSAPPPFEIAWSPLALARLREIRAYISLDNALAAERLATRIITLVEALKLQPYLGHPSNEPNLRELVIGGTPYVILYRVRRQQILVTTIHHSAQQRPDI